MPAFAILFAGWRRAWTQSTRFRIDHEMLDHVHFRVVGVRVQDDAVLAIISDIRMCRRAVCISVTGFTQAGGSVLRRFGHPGRACNRRKRRPHGRDGGLHSRNHHRASGECRAADHGYGNRGHREFRNGQITRHNNLPLGLSQASQSGVVSPKTDVAGILHRETGLILVGRSHRCDRRCESPERDRMRQGAYRSIEIDGCLCPICAGNRTHAAVDEKPAHVRL